MVLARTHVGHCCGRLGTMKGKTHGEYYCGRSDVVVRELLDSDNRCSPSEGFDRTFVAVED